MEIGKAFSFVTEDERWITKVLIGGLILWVPIVNFAAVGYMLKVAENVSQGNPRPLPEWNEFGDHFMKGLYYLAINIVYALPLIVVVGLLYCVFGGIAASGSESGAAAGISGIFFCVFPLALILGLLTNLLGFAATARYLATNNLSEAFKFQEVFAQVRSNIRPWLMLLLVYILASFVGSLGSIACGIGALFTGFYGLCAFGHAFGQTIAEQRGSTGISATPPSYTPPPTYQ